MRIGVLSTGPIDRSTVRVFGCENTIYRCVRPGGIPLQSAVESPGTEVRVRAESSHG